MVGKFQVKVLAAFAKLLKRKYFQGICASDRFIGFVFKVMVRNYHPEKTDGLYGTVQYVLTDLEGIKEFWFLSINAKSATVSRSFCEEATVVLEMGVIDFLRVVCGELKVSQAMLESRLTINGDFILASRLPEIFGGDSLYVTESL